MNGLAPRSVCIAALLLLLLLPLAGCGKKGPVRPLHAAAPEAPVDLKVRQQGTSFLLSWQAPTTNQDASTLTEIRGFQIFRDIYDADAGCPTCREPGNLVANITLQNPAAVRQIKRRFYWRDRHLAIGSGYAYRVVALTHGRRVGAAALVDQVCLEPPEAPQKLQAAFGQEGTLLSWQASGGGPADATPAGFNLYRKLADRPSPLVPVNTKPLRQTQLVDRSLQSGKHYVYRVGALVRVGKLLIESPLSEPLLVNVPAKP